MASKALQDKKVFDFVGKFKIFVSISLAVIVIGIIMNIIFGVQLSITFKGGSTITYSYENDIDTDAVAKTVKEKAYYIYVIFSYFYEKTCKYSMFFIY